jgi:hypothetical protein
MRRVGITPGTSSVNPVRAKPKKPHLVEAEALARKLVYARSRGYCEMCGLWGATDWHHRMDRSVGGKWLAVNGLHLDRRCHAWITDEATLARPWGWAVESWYDPAKVPVYLAHRSWSTWSWLLPGGDVQSLSPDELEQARERYGLARPIGEAS